MLGSLHPTNIWYPLDDVNLQCDLLDKKPKITTKNLGFYSFLHCDLIPESQQTILHLE